MNKLIGLAFGASVVLAGCGQSQSPQSDAKTTDDLQTVTMASTGSDADVWR